jgi:Domain of Unknown Function (DUF748)
MRMNESIARARGFALRHRIGLSVALLLFIVYTLGGFLLVPYLVKTQATRYVAETLHRKLAIADVQFNPFTFVATVKGLALTEQNGDPMIRFNRLMVNAELSSIIHRAIVLKEVQLDSPDIEVVISKDGKVNLAELAPPSAASPPPPPTPADVDKPLPRVRIGKLQLTGGRIGIDDRLHARPVKVELSPVQFVLTEFATDPNYRNAYHFTGKTEAGESLDWAGGFTVQPLGSTGDFRVGDLKATTIDEYLATALKPRLASGTITLNGSYRLALTPFSLDLNVPTIAVRDLSVTERSQPDVVPISIPAIDVTNASYSSDKRSVHVAAIAIQKPHVDVVRLDKGVLNVQTLFAGPSTLANSAPAASLPTITESTTATSPAPETTPPSSSPASSTQPTDFQVVVDAVDVVEGSVGVEDRTVKPVAKFALAPIGVKLENVSSDAHAPLKMSTTIGVNQTGKVAATATLTREPLEGDYTLDVADLPLPALQPYLSRDTAINLSSGEFGTKGSGTFAQNKDRPFKVTYQGDLGVTKLKTTDQVENERLIEWDELAVAGIDFGLAPDKLRIARVYAKQPYARVEIGKNRSLNVSNALRVPPPPPPDATAEEPESDDTEPVASPAPAPSAPSSPSTAKGNAKPDGAFPTQIKTIEVADGTLLFADLSIQPQFRAAILNLNGSVKGLSSDPASRAEVDFKGSVDRYAPVDIKGQVNLLSAAKYTDLALNFRNMELTLFNPYSGKFAGYNISKGKLSTELHYKVDDRKLDAQHHIILDNLEFGAKTDSKDAAPIPLKFVVAILKDGNGVINLNVPVSGSLDNPQFRLGPIIWKAVLGLLRKIATAPFAAIGALFGGGPELAYIDFAPGSAELTQPELDKLQKLTQALVSRQQLKLSLPITAFGDLDRAALTQSALATQVPPPASDADDAARKKYLGALEAFYKKLAGKEIAYPDTLKAKGAAGVAERTEFLEPAVKGLVKPDDDALATLGRDRAQAIQNKLLTDTGIDPQRVFVTTEPSEKANIDGHARLQMKLE